MNDIVNLLAAFVGLRFEQAENQVLCCTAMGEIPVCFLPRFTAMLFPSANCYSPPPTKVLDFISDGKRHKFPSPEAECGGSWFEVCTRNGGIP